MLKDSTIGVVTGTGTYWKMGPNKTADPIVITTENNPRVLLVQRNDNKNWAFAGGYVDMGEAAIETARRELSKKRVSDLIARQSLLYMTAWLQMLVLQHMLGQKQLPSYGA